MWIRLVVYLGFIPLFYFGLCWYLASGYVKPARNVAGNLPSSMRVVTIDHEPHRLVAWASHGLVDGEPQYDTVVILAHGYGGNRDHWEFLIDHLAGRAEIVAPTMQGQDASLADKVGFGPGEAAEIVSAARWAREQYDSDPNVVLFGVSLGGSACWLAAGEHPELFDAVVTEGAFAPLESASDEFLGFVFRRGSSLMRPVIWFANMQGGIDPSKVRPVDAAKKWNGPALVIHGQEDALFGTHHAEELAAACGGELWLVEELTHAQLAGDDPAGLADRILNVARRSP